MEQTPYATLMPMTKNTQPKHKKALIISLIIVIALAIAGFFFFQNYEKESTVTSKTNRPSFTFDAVKAPGWQSGGNNWPNPDNYSEDSATKEPLPIANIIVHQEKQNTRGECFVMFFYKEGPVVAQAALQELEASAPYQKVGVIPKTIETFEGTKTYELYQYDLKVPAEEKMMTGIEIAYVPLSKGYVEIQGSCMTAEYLPNTVSILDSVKLKK